MGFLRGFVRLGVSLLAVAPLLGLVPPNFGCTPDSSKVLTSELWLNEIGTVEDDALYAVTGVGNVFYAAGGTKGKLPGASASTTPPDGYLVKFDSLGQVAWQNQYGTLSADEWRGVAVDASGNAYVVGYTAGLYPGQVNAGGSTDAVIARIKPDGTLLWLRQLGTTGDDYLLGVVLDGSGNAYAAGWTSGTFPGKTLSGASDAFIVKYRPDGTQEWLTQFGSPKEDALTSIASDGSGALYAGGWATDAALPGQSPLGNRDGVIYKIQSSGTVVWARQFGSSEDDEASAVAVAGGNIYAGGRTFGTIPGQTTNGRLDGVIASYDANGSQRFLKQIGTGGDDELLTLAAAPDGSGVFAGGYVGRSFENAEWHGLLDAIYAKVNPDGSVAWSTQFGSAADDKVLGLFSAESGILYAAGSVSAALASQSLIGKSDAFIARYSVP